MIKQKSLLVLSGAILLLGNSCTTFSFNSFGKPKELGKEDKSKEEQSKSSKKEAFVNPYPAGTYEHFKAEPTYKKTYKIYKNESLLGNTNKTNSKLNIDLSDQRAQLINTDAGLVAMDYPIASGKTGHETPTGTFSILEKMEKKRSNLYGKYVNAAGETVKSNVTNGKTPKPEGATFLGASMPYWMRFTWTGIGHHIGNVPRYPASHGCIRGYRPAMATVYSKVKVGTPVLIQD